MRINFDKNNLINQIKAIHGSGVFSRGKDYYNNGLVGGVKISETKNRSKIKIQAKVRGSRVYSTSIFFNLANNEFDDLSCNCPYDWGDCKHSAALGLKFVDLYKELADKKKDFFNVSEIVKMLMNFSNDDEYHEDENNFSGDDEEGYQEAEIIDTTNKNDSFYNSEVEQKKTERLKKLLQMIGIDAESLSREALEELGGKFALNKKIRAIKPENKTQNETLKEKTLKDISKDYCLILDVDYIPKIEIHRNKSYGFYYGECSSTDILRKERSNLLTAQKDLLEFLQNTNFWYDQQEEIDWGKIFKLIKNSGFEIYLDEKTIKNRMYFTENPQKIVAEIYQKETENHSNHGEITIQNDFVFRLLGDFYQKNSIYSFYGREHLVLMKNKQVEIHPVSEKLSKMLSHILKAGENYYNGYYYQNDKSKEYFWETDFSDEEIIGINEIILDAQKYLDLKTDLPMEFETKQFQKIGPAISVDYDSANEKLRVRATVDYGFSKVDVAHTVYKSIKGGVAGFQKKTFKNREKYHIKIEENKIHYAPIARKEEKNLFSKFHKNDKFGFNKNLKCIRENTKNILHFYKNYWSEIKALNYPIEYIRDEFNFYEEEFKANFDVDMNAENDWLGFDVNCYCGKDRISIADLKKYIQNKEEFIRMNDGRMLRISNWEDLERFILMLESFYEKENGQFEGRAYHAPELENIFTSSPHYNAKIAEGFKNFMAEAQSGKPIEKIKLPAGISKTLRSYQKEGIHWFYFLRKYRFAGILADDMGTGKTLQALTLAMLNKIENKPSIVICPKTLLFNWEQEAEKFFPEMKTLIIEGFPDERRKKIKSIKKCDLIITSYSTIKKDFDFYEKIKAKFNYCFLDEAQFVKNHRTQNSRIVKRIPADYRLALTGTPLENSVSEIWSIFDFLMPGFLGNYNNFVKKFHTPIMKHSDAKALENLRKKVECFMLRRTKNEVLKELPPKIEQVISCELEEAQNILYKEILASVKKDIFETVEEKGFKKSQIHILAGLTKLRQVCNHPVLLLKDKDYTKYESAKLDGFIELINEIVSSGRKVLVFSQFTKMLDILEKVFNKNKIDYLYLCGKTTNRKELVEEFNGNYKIKVFLISLKAGGVGLNLTSADNVIIFDPWWNPSVENQAIDRTHRIGQKKSVNVYRLITKGTIEEKIVKLQEKKKFLFDNLVGESKDLFQKLTWDDVKELFK